MKDTEVVVVVESVPDDPLEDPHTTAPEEGWHF